MDNTRDLDPKSASYWTNKYASLLKGPLQPNVVTNIQSESPSLRSPTPHSQHENEIERDSRRDEYHEVRARREESHERISSRREDNSNNNYEGKLRKEQELRIRAEQEQARLLTANHDITLQLVRLKSEGQDDLRDARARVEELETKLEALQEVHETGEVALGKYRLRAEQVMRELEASQADQDRSRRRAEEALARTVAAAHTQLTQKQEALVLAEQARASEQAARTRIQAQLETFVAQRTAQLDQLDSQLASAKVRELDLSSKLSEANQRVEELTRRQALSDANSQSLKELLASVGGVEDKTRERELEREEWEKTKRAAAQRESELSARLAEQNHIIRLLRQTLASSAPSPSSFSMPSVSPIPTNTSIQDPKVHDLLNRNEFLQNTLDERDNQLKRAAMELEEANKKIERMVEQRNNMPIDVPSARVSSPDDKRKIEEQLIEERKKFEEEISTKNKEIYSLQEQIQRLQKELDTKNEMATNAQMMQAEMDESHINEIKLLEQVEQYEFTVMQLRGRVAELERFIVEDSGGSFGTS